jgi:hypothetical protein
MDPDTVPSVLLEQLKEYSGDMWDKCDHFFADLVANLFPEPFDYNISFSKFVRELQSCTGMKYSNVSHITIWFVPIDLIAISSNIPPKLCVAKPSKETLGSNNCSWRKMMKSFLSIWVFTWQTSNNR